MGVEDAGKLLESRLAGMPAPPNVRKRSSDDAAAVEDVETARTNLVAQFSQPRRALSFSVVHNTQLTCAWKRVQRSGTASEAPRCTVHPALVPRWLKKKHGDQASSELHQVLCKFRTFVHFHVRIFRLTHTERKNMHSAR